MEKGDSEENFGLREKMTISFGLTTTTWQSLLSTSCDWSNLANCIKTTT